MIRVILYARTNQFSERISEKKGRIALVVPHFPTLSETFIVSKFLGLLESGWDVHIVSWKRDKGGWKHFPELANQKDIRRRVHVLWPYRPFWLVAMLMPFAILRCFLRHPTKAWFYLKRGWPKFRE